jgi:hypothetical protein
MTIVTSDRVGIVTHRCIDGKGETEYLHITKIERDDPKVLYSMFTYCHSNISHHDNHSLYQLSLTKAKRRPPSTDH